MKSIVLLLLALPVFLIGCGDAPSLNDVPPSEDPALTEPGPSVDGVATERDPALGG